MGVSTILAAKKIYLMAWGEDKAKMVKECVEGAVTDTIPASFLQTHNNAHVVIDLSAAGNLTRIHRPWLVTSCEWNDKLIRSAIVWLCQLTGKPILKLTNKDYNENGLSELLALFGSAYNVNIKIFNDLQHTITGWPGGKPNADDTYRPERAKPYPKRIVVFSPHPDDDVISMGGTIRRLVEQKHDVHVAYETSGNIAVGDEEVIRFLHFINGFNQIFNNSEDKVVVDKYAEIRKFLKEKKDGDIDTRDILTIKGLIRRGEARTACTYNNIPLWTSQTKCTKGEKSQAVSPEEKVTLAPCRVAVQCNVLPPETFSSPYVSILPSFNNSGSSFLLFCPTAHTEQVNTITIDNKNVFMVILSIFCF